MVKQRQKTQPTEATFNIYQLYKIPNYEPENTHELQLINDELTNIIKRFSLCSKVTINKAIKQHNNVRVYAVANFKFINTLKKENEEGRYFTRNENLERVDFTNYSDFNNYIFDRIRMQFDIVNGYGYVIIYAIESVDINIIKYNPLQGASYTEIPVHIKNTKSIINIKNKDQKCFLYSLIASR